jgi:hypothetical protein
MRGGMSSPYAPAKEPAPGFDPDGAEPDGAEPGGAQPGVAYPDAAGAAAPSANGSGPLIVGYPPVPGTPAPVVPPMYWRVLRLSSVRPNGWQRAALVEGVTGISVILALADVASAWTILVLPLVAMAIVKAHDYLVGLLHPDRRSEPPPARLADYAVFAGIPLGILALRVLIHPTGQQGETSGIVLGVLAYLAVAVLVYRYLRRRGVATGRAAAIAGVTFVLTPLAGILGAALEVRRRQAEGQGVPGSPSYGP